MAEASSFPSSSEVLGSADLTVFAVGVALAAVLIVVARALLPHDAVGKTRIPIALVFATIACVSIGVAVSEWPSGYKVFRLAAIFTLLLALARIGFVVAVDGVLSRRSGVSVPKIFRDIFEGVVYGAVVLVTLQQAGARLDALLTTSALLTAVIGLSLQDTLGNLFAGLSIQAQNPFEVGDWIQYDDEEKTLGCVIEINWRATKVMTLDAVEVIIPNGLLARAPIRNFTRPTPMSRRSIAVVVPFETSPHRVQSVLLRALRQVDDVVTEPAPTVLTAGFEERGMKYWLHYFIRDFARREGIDATVRDRVWFALRREGIEFARPIARVHLEEREDASAQAAHGERGRTKRAVSLRQVDFLRVLSDEQISAMADLTAERLYAEGELILRQGEVGDELFILEHGEVAVLLGPDLVEVARLHRGAFFGEMSVLTGAPRRASVRAVVDVEVLVVGTDAVKRLLDESPELAEQISDALTSRQEELDSAHSRTSESLGGEQRVAERRELLGRIREFFSLSSS